MLRLEVNVRVTLHAYTYVLLPAPRNLEVFVFKPRKRWFVAAFAATMLALTGVAVARSDFGSETQERLNSKASENFGVKETLPNSSKLAVTQAQALADPTSLITLAKGLSARVVTTSSGVNTDQIAFWPNDTQPTHLIVCNEQEEAEPGLQRINLQTGATDTIVTGTVECDPVRRTAWGTVIFGEEDGTDGHLYELIDPLPHDRRHPGPDDRDLQWRHEPAEPGSPGIARTSLVRRLRPVAERRLLLRR